MYLQQAESNGPARPEPQRAGPEKPLTKFSHHSTNLPFGQHITLESLGGPSYVTSQTVIEQVAYSLSDRLWTYSPESFDLDVATKYWVQQGEKNVYGYPTSVETMQIRQGAASIALGYIYSKDFDLAKRNMPQSILASSSALQHLRAALDHLSLLYSVASPLVVHIAAIDYAGASSQLVADYIPALLLAEELGLGLVSSFSAYEAQHMAIFSTLLASIIPTIHIYDGVSVGRETARVVDVLGHTSLQDTFATIRQETLATKSKNENIDSKLLHLLSAFNGEFGTQYDLFEYHGHASPDSVLVVFGSVESSLASQIAHSFKKDGVKCGVVNVRIYSPFLEQRFLDALPDSVTTIGVLGQVQDRQAVSDHSVHSILYKDVVAATAFATRWTTPPTILDIKYSRETVWTPISIAAAFQLLVKRPILRAEMETESPEVPAASQLLSPSNMQQYVFWDKDTSHSANAPIAFGKALALDSSNNIVAKTSYDNLRQGGVFRSDIRRSKQAIEAPYPIDTADVLYIGERDLLKTFDVLNSVKAGGKVLIKLPNVKDDDLEKSLPAEFRRTLSVKGCRLYIIDPLAVDVVADDPELETYLTQIAFLRVAIPELERIGVQKLARINGSTEVFERMAIALESALRMVEIPETWAHAESMADAPILADDIQVSSFTAFDKVEVKPLSYLKDWKVAAKGLAFKEAFQTKSALRPDQSVKTYTVRVSENRRLTPPSYDRNIFHIEFDLGDSGLTYDIGEALGIHAENDEVQVNEFIEFYKLNPEEVVEVPSREDSSIFENRTIYQALMQNIDIFGRPPKKFYDDLSEFADDPKEQKELHTLGGPEGANEFKRRGEVDTITYADILLEFPSAHPSFHDIVRIVNPMKRREYSIASCQKVTPNSVALMIVVVGWVDPKGRDRFGQATRFLNKLRVGSPVTVSVKPSVMKLPPKSTQPLIMAGLGTGLAPFRAFVQHRAWEKAQGIEVGAVLLYMGSRHQREEYCYGEEWEAYQAAGVITLLGRAFSRDQPQKIYIQDRMRQTMNDIIQAYLKQDGVFYLCGPTWPVPDVTNVLQDAIVRDAKTLGKRVDSRKEIEKLKDDSRYVLEVY